MRAIDATWRKSTYSNQSGGACVEVANPTHTVLVRDSKHPEYGHLAFDPGEWRAFLTDLRDGQL